jgi:L-seryl-tRNA(Ser) seleniumtransferase
MARTDTSAVPHRADEAATGRGTTGTLADAPDGPSLYRSLGIRPVINAAAALTTLGGSVMPPSVVTAMAKAAECFVPINELQAAVGKRIAQLTHNEAALVVGGSAAGLAEVTAALLAGSDPYLIRRLPDTAGLRRDVLIHKCQRYGFDQAVRTAGARLVEFGLPAQTMPDDLEGSISDQTLAVLYVSPGARPTGALSLPETIGIAHRRGIPVIVDAAAQLPPVTNLWHFTRDLGADVAIFSGGKDLHGPQATGLVVGRRAIIDAVALNGYPNQGIGRPMKIGKEGIIGALAALEAYLRFDHVARLEDCERQVRHLQEVLAGIDGVTVRRVWPGEAGESLPRALVELAPGAARFDRAGLQALLRAGDPIIEVGAAPQGVYVNPATLGPGEMEVVAQKLHELLASGTVC